MDFFNKLFSDNSDVSAMRVMSVFALVVASIIAVVGLYQNRDLNQLSTLVGVFVGAAFGGKAMQKFAEVKTEIMEKVNNEKK